MGYVIVSLAVVSLMTVLILAIKANYSSEAALVAGELAQELLEEVRLRKWDEGRADARPGYPAYSKTAPGDLGPDAGETALSKTTFNDVDDFQGWSESPPQDPVGRALSGFSRYKRTVTVQYVDSSLAASGSATDYKLVTVCASQTSVAQACLRWLAANP